MSIDYETAYQELREVVKRWYRMSRNDISDDCFKSTLNEMDRLEKENTYDFHKKKMYIPKRS